VDVTRRWAEHCSGKAGAKFFRSDQPAALCLVESGLNRSSASQREAAIKKLSPTQKRQLIRCQGPARLVGLNDS
jgi:putative endonuclease